MRPIEEFWEDKAQSKCSLLQILMLINQMLKYMVIWALNVHWGHKLRHDLREQLKRTTDTVIVYSSSAARPISSPSLVRQETDQYYWAFVARNPDHHIVFVGTSTRTSECAPMQNWTRLKLRQAKWWASSSDGDVHERHWSTSAHRSSITPSG